MSSTLIRSAVWVLVQKGAGFGSIKQVKMRGANTDWLYLTNTWGSAWEINPTPQLPWDFIFKGENGQEVRIWQSPFPSLRCLWAPLHA
jgi:hypothetical protein